jgi:hypothetical protein
MLPTMHVGHYKQVETVVGNYILQNLRSYTAKKDAAVSICNLQLVVMWLINVPFYVLY